MVLPTRPVRIQPYYGYRNEDRLRISARALRADHHRYDRRGRIQAFRTMLAHFVSHEVAGLAVKLVVERNDGLRSDHHAQTDAEGFVHFDVELNGKWLHAKHTRWEVVELHWTNRNGDQCVEGHVLSPGDHADLAVISDIDDTIIETGITGGVRSLLRNWRRVLAELPDDRIAVPGADAFYGALGGGALLDPDMAQAGKGVPATHRPFFYVSSSPWNLFSYLVAFKQARGLPLGPIMLRDWGMNSETFGSSSHGAHKTEAIGDILAHYPHLRFALIGDDTQGDLPAYAELVERFPTRIAAIFIRTAAGEPLSAEEIAGKATIEAHSVPLWLGDDYSTGQNFLRAAGLSSDRDAEKIVETVEQEAK
ncbi:hypothetical protein AMC99_02466 [Altererythrobacter epoxidivorans]|uniref:Phosphatidate phosphatase APP1 catalytic domain-containing protein n=1 Tax=Altererythrobacter epoxidivorans TaxID=361183 RepID=A0A0M4MA18_9SPHN|nr:phosphatase domain-containing protein [Altererythrobacter epoxidivorans]ALE17739.1 hypothetical protein AMC99_02466 [Altererythrobacter epoxidivorans]